MTSDEYGSLGCDRAGGVGDGWGGVVVCVLAAGVDCAWRRVGAGGVVGGAE